MACRRFQHGLATVEQIKDEYPVRLLLEGKTKASKRSIGSRNTRRITMMNSLGSRDSLNYIKNIDRLIESKNNDEYYDRRQNDIKDVIAEAQSSLEQAINNLELGEDSDADIERSYLDCAIHISFIILELELYLNIIEGKDGYISPEAAQQVQQGNWSSFLTKRITARTYMGRLKQLQHLQDGYLEKEYLTT